MKHLFVLFLLLCCLCRAVAVYEGLAIAIAIAGAATMLYCRVKECCQDRWIPQNFSTLEEELDKRVFGQHIAIEVVHKAIKGHIQNVDPAKALVLSFHGWTGCGKNYVSNIIAENLYTLGMYSQYTHQVIATHDFPHKEKLLTYKDKLKNFITENVKKCPRTLFIFDEVDKVPAGLMDTLKPFLEHHLQVGGVDYRKAIFIFLSNTGAKTINNFVISHWEKGNKREDLTFKDMEVLINNGAFNSEGGLWHSQLIQYNLIDFFVPFMPLEKSHIKQCIRVDLKHKNIAITDEIVNQVADQMQYSSPGYVFSTTGCKKVSTRVDFVTKENNKLP